MINVDVLSEDKKWSKKISKKEDFFNKLLKFFPKKYKFINKKVSLTLLLSNNKRVKKLNKQFRNKNKATDILSFPFYEKLKLKKKIRIEKEVYLGDIIINLNKVKNKKNKVKFREELNNLWIQGLVYLFGQKHKKNKEFHAMNKIEKKFIEFIN